jgi:hypothetical protein
MSRTAILASYSLRSVASLNVFLFVTVALFSNERTFLRLEPWLIGSSLAVVILSLLGLVSERRWKSKVVDLLFAATALAILGFVSISSLPGL